MFLNQIKKLVFNTQRLRFILIKNKNNRNSYKQNKKLKVISISINTARRHHQPRRGVYACASMYRAIVPFRLNAMYCTYRLCTAYVQAIGTYPLCIALQWNTSYDGTISRGQKAVCTTSVSSAYRVQKYSVYNRQTLCIVVYRCFI